MDDFYPFFLVFAQKHWFMTWCALWILWAPYWLAKALILLASRTMRFVVVLLRGWPPAHLDADGDWKPAAKEASK